MTRHKWFCPAVLLGLAALLGVYHISRTVVISEDGVLYIKMAQTLPGGYAEICRKFPPGFPMLLYLARKLAFLSADFSVNLSWIHSSQTAVLLTQLGALFFLWKIGCRLFRPVWTFAGLLILLVLPISKHGCDVLRDWPHLLFLSAAFYALLRNLEKQSLLGWMVSAFLGGVGYLFRPECAQILLYLAVVLSILFWKQRTAANAGRLLTAAVLIAAAWLLPVLPYWLYADSILPAKLPAMVRSITPDFFSPSNTLPPKTSFPTALFDFLQDLTENFLYILLPFWLIGLLHFFRIKYLAKNLSRIMLTVFLAVNVFLLLSLYIGWGYICRRHILPFIALSCPLIPLGIWLLSYYLHCQSSLFLKVQTRRIFVGCLMIAVLTAAPKLAKPLHYDKKVYLQAAEWISEHIEPSARIFADDKRVPFYAERQIASSEKDADYRILITSRKSATNSPSADSILQTWSNGKIMIQFCKTAGSIK
ncbi:MAG TPA: glycosyltransferase family 39 protein [Anaerohalosphaeraceae bacterium]|nr:glycosyltransferase family 39 protein [Anaerohalosphaeraceae bacterium]